MNKGSFRKRSGTTSSLRFGEGLDTVKKKETGCEDDAFGKKVSVDQEEPLGHGFFSRTLHGSLRRRTRKGWYPSDFYNNISPFWNKSVISRQPCSSISWESG